MYSRILYSEADGIARIVLNRPEKRNALDAQLTAELRAALAVSAESAMVRVVLITGSGPDFSAGADLGALQKIAANGPLENIADARAIADIFLAVRRHPHPVVSAVRGRALAGGCGLATACDLVTAAESAEFGYPEVNIGFVPAMVMALLRRQVSEKRAFELLSLGRTIPAREALSLGMINAVTSDERLADETEELVTRLAKRSASALTMTKELLYRTDGLSFEAALEAGVYTNALARTTEDCRRGIARFLERQP